MHTETRVVEGAPANALSELAREIEADEIVVGSRGMGRFAAALGSVSHALLAHADRPVVVVPRAAADHPRDLIKGGMEAYGVTTNPVFFPGNVEPRYSEFLTFVGVSVDEDGRQHYLDSQIAYRRACLNAIAYLEKFGYSPEQAYLLLGAAPIEGRFSGVVDIPNSCATLYLPTAIFDFDIRPSADGPQRADRGTCAMTS